MEIMKVKVTKTVTVLVSPTANVHYEEGWSGTAPHDHIAKIVAAGCGEEVAEESSGAHSEPAAATSQAEGGTASVADILKS
jgi:hypothetical protein